MPALRAVGEVGLGRGGLRFCFFFGLTMESHQVQPFLERASRALLYHCYWILCIKTICSLHYSSIVSFSTSEVLLAMLCDVLQSPALTSLHVL
jgi:hypothetical protein